MSEPSTDVAPSSNWTETPVRLTIGGIYRKTDPARFNIISIEPDPTSPGDLNTIEHLSRQIGDATMILKTDVDGKPELVAPYYPGKYRRRFHGITCDEETAESIRNAPLFKETTISGILYSLPNENFTTEDSANSTGVEGVHPKLSESSVKVNAYTASSTVKDGTGNTILYFDSVNPATDGEDSQDILFLKKYMEGGEFVVAENPEDGTLYNLQPDDISIYGTARLRDETDHIPYGLKADTQLIEESRRTGGDLANHGPVTGTIYWKPIDQDEMLASCQRNNRDLASVKSNTSQQ
ncbi:uncharacterized protein IL334_007337 [Kwoniella shivajii]|uniref:Uncharacterized protein n=1 Tax=Kwoniella shivajii TaxID=564305 RepID=A0ABZ1DAN5_9TREE|nr:hypothetical protein IL334_007337 [Kwoniella shivajii]